MRPVMVIMIVVILLIVAVGAYKLSGISKKDKSIEHSPEIEQEKENEEPKPVKKEETSVESDEQQAEGDIEKQEASVGEACTNFKIQYVCETEEAYKITIENKGPGNLEKFIVYFYEPLYGKKWTSHYGSFQGEHKIEAFSTKQITIPGYKNQLYQKEIRGVRVMQIIGSSDNCGSSDYGGFGYGNPATFTNFTGDRLPKCE